MPRVRMRNELEETSQAADMWTSDSWRTFPVWVNTFEIDWKIFAEEEMDDLWIIRCDDCWEYIYKNNSYTVNGMDVCETCIDRYSPCDYCGEMVISNDMYITANWDYVCEHCADEHYFTCSDCWEMLHIDNSITTARWNLVCETCMDNNYIECAWCEELFHEDDLMYDEDSDNYYCEDCRPSISASDISKIRIEDDDTDIKEWVCSWEKVRWATFSKWLTTLDVQTEYNKWKEKVVDVLANFYPNGYADNIKLFKSEDINKEFKIWTMDWIKYIKSYVDSVIKPKTSVSRTDIASMKNKYKAIKNIKVNDDKKISYEEIDLYWKLRKKTIAPLTIHKYFKSIFWEEVNWGFPANQFNADYKYTITFSNSIDNKIETAESAAPVFGSCQSVANCNFDDSWGYARWIADLFSNWYTVPCIIKEWERIVWRIITRFLFAKDGTKYLLVDRLYAKWSLADKKKDAYQEIVKWLIDLWYNVIVSWYSEHDDSVYRYLAENSNGLSFKEKSEVLRQPTHNKSRNNYYWYYHDSWTVTFENNNWWVYDVLMRNFYIVTKE